MRKHLLDDNKSQLQGLLGSTEVPFRGIIGGEEDFAHTSNLACCCVL